MPCGETDGEFYDGAESLSQVSRVEPEPGDAGCGVGQSQSNKDTSLLTGKWCPGL